MSWKTDYRSIYYEGAPEPDDLVLPVKETALLVIDIQNTYLERPDRAKLSKAEQAHFDAWTPFHERMHSQVIPRTAELLKLCRAKGIECLFARIATHTLDGRERSLSQKMPGWNNLLLPKNEKPSQLVAELAPAGDEIVVTKTTDSALTGTNLAPYPAQSRHQERDLRRHLHRPMRVLNRAQPGRRKLQCGGGGGLLRRWVGRTAPQGTGNHQHDLLPRPVEPGTQDHDAAGVAAMLRLAIYSQDKIVHNFCQNLPEMT